MQALSNLCVFWETGISGENSRGRWEFQPEGWFLSLRPEFDFGLYLDGTLVQLPVVGAAVARPARASLEVGDGRLGWDPRTHNQVLITSGFRAPQSILPLGEDGPSVLSSSSLSQPVCS